MFRSSARKPEPVAVALPPAYLTVYAAEAGRHDPHLAPGLESLLPPGTRYELAAPPEPQREGTPLIPASSEFVVSLFLDPEQLDGIADKVLAARSGGRHNSLVIVINGRQFGALGRWLERRSSAGRLAGVHLMVARDVSDALAQLPRRLSPVVEDNLIRMPTSTEIDNPGYKSFYIFSPELHAVVARIRAFAKNGVSRAYLLGGPGSGKTSLAFYYFLVRNKGRFVSVNLAAENTGDKAAIKSLLCGHVSGAFPGAGGRTGAFSHARDGVCFLDEAHGVTGAVMETLMEALDNGQYLPFGASAKQSLDCALLFATNRSWEHLRNSVNIDEFTRLGAATISVPELHRREEDMIAVVAANLAKLGSRCTSWRAPEGLSEPAWQAIRDCRWHGNVRALTRVLEAAFVDSAMREDSRGLLELDDVRNGIALWEPADHHSHAVYASN
ncbi:hypothetical protein ED208_08715 [Stagnimonas aquatica]|uniref:Sigma-54 factor interaction domain-containing protein n=1 Tax=Stagnimonas aquatica TaxID=2689987 RepID=A0A3N0VE99_9GAMM|nr:sigma 54-interacting transcriptional regulator [Stagnimonas aquatica]ROH91040.1 hypothetical protein ED208_08715 [Stagnimonas aquatica]